jgi:hypothetical protein
LAYCAQSAPLSKPPESFDDLTEVERLWLRMWDNFASGRRRVRFVSPIPLSARTSLHEQHTF